MKEIYSPYIENKKKQEKAELYNKVKTFGKGVILVALLAGGIHYLSKVGAGGGDFKDNTDLFNSDNTIQEITLKPNANIRYDHTTGGQDVNNLIESVKDETKVPIDKDTVYIHDEGEAGNGKWYGLPATDLEKVGIDASVDKDGIAWVNEQGVDHIERANK